MLAWFEYSIWVIYNMSCTSYDMNNVQVWINTHGRPSTSAGNDVVIVKSGRRICGTGAALANAPIVQDKAYFEAKLQSSGNKISCFSYWVYLKARWRTCIYIVTGLKIMLLDASNPALLIPTPPT